MLPSFPACPVATDEPETGFADGPGLLPAGRSLAGDDSFALDSLLVSAERFITLFHSENRAGPPDRRLRQVRREIEATGTYRHTPAELSLRRACRLAQQLAVHRAAVLAEPAGTRPPRGHCGTGHRRRVDRAPARGHERRPDPAGDHGVRAGRPAGQDRGSSARSSSGTRATQTADGTVTGDPANTARHPPRPRPRLARRPASRPVRRPAAARAGRRRPRHHARAARRRGPRGPHRAPGVRLVRRPRAAVVRRAGDQRHVPGHRRRPLPRRAVQRLVYVHGDRIARPRRHRPLRPAAGDRQAAWACRRPATGPCGKTRQ